MANSNHNSDDSENRCNLQQIFVIIPALNEEATLGQVIASLQSYGLTHICVVDNGSCDRTIAIAKAAGAQVVCEPVQGYGQACWLGLQQVPDHCEWILFCDGDGSDDLRQLPQFFAATPQSDFILGNRRAQAKSRAALTPVQNFGNGLATHLIALGWGHRYHDLGPLRLIRRSSLVQMQMSDRSFGWTVEMQAKAIEWGLKICEIPVGYYPRQGGQSKISGTIWGSFQAGIIILSTVSKLYLHKLGLSTPLIPLFLSSLLLLLGVILTLPYGDFQQPGMVARFWIGIGIMGLGFIFSWQIKSINSLWFWTITLLTRILLLAMYPSDDIWRYLWEGYIQNLGFSPYDFAPTAPELIPYRTDWWELINNKDTAAIYPPLTQLGFRLLAFLAPSVLIFKLAFISADLGICGLLSRRFGVSHTLLYAWNPLIIYSFAGGGHYDSWFILPLVAGWLAFEQNSPLKSAVLIGLSAAVKWISFPLLLFLLFKTRWKQRVIIVLLGILPLFITALLFCHDGQCSLIPTRSAFVSHGRSAEFIPYFVGLVWPLSTQYNWIYAIPLVLMIVLLLRFCRDFTGFIEGYFFCLLLLSPIVHAWYFTWIVPWTVATRNLGVRWVSLSAFIYFVLKDRQTLGNFDWTLTPLERYWLWLPFIVGFLWTKFNSKSRLHSI